MQNYHYIFIGPQKSGKTSALSCLSEISLSQIQNMLSEHHATSKLLTLPNMEQAVLRIEDSKNAYLYNYDHQVQIDQHLSVVGEEADGGVIFINHAHNDALDQLEHYITLLSQQVENLVVAITHVDLDSQQLLKRYRNWLIMKKLNIPIFMIDARKKNDIELLIEVLVARNDIH